MAARLIASGANVNARGLDDDTPLHDAASNGHIALSRLLVERGADIHAKNKKGKTPLEVAAPGIAQFLLDTNIPVPGNSLFILYMFSVIFLFSLVCHQGYVL